MKKSELRLLLREEIRKILIESDAAPEMSKQELDIIKNAKPGDIVKVQQRTSGYSPTKMVKATLLEPFRKDRNSGLLIAFAKQGKYLELITIDYQDMYAAIVQGWQDDYSERFVRAAEQKFKLKTY